MLVNSFLTYIRCELNLSVHTVSSYKRDIEQWREFATGGKIDTFEPRDVTTNDLRLWVAHLAQNKASQRTIRRKVQSVRAFYRYLNKYHNINNNPAAELQLARVSKELPIYIRTGEMTNLLNKEWDKEDFISTRDHLIMLMFYSTGMRCSELETLTDVNVDTSRGELKVLGKRNKERIIPFGKEMSETIETYRQLRDDLAGRPTERFFTRPTGEPMYRKLIYNIVHRQLTEAGVHSSRQSPHVLRHSFASDMLNNGASINAVQQLLGHQSLATTQVYTHITYRELKLNYQHAHPRALKKGG
ncbi:MAG: tyrosine-type recombinase/integrase [Muribaculaceae bacterium]|nr:tyrosine-type recombinase/integrase [Muribaculaceae bacterium]